MANLTPVAGYDQIPQLEKTDRVVGGAGGTSNEQAQALINNIEQIKQDYINNNKIGNPNGVASLDENGKVPQSQIPTTGSLRGSWNVNTNTPTITQGSAVVGGVTVGNSDYFMVSVAGTWNGITFDVGDRLVWSSDNSNWFRLAGSSVTSVNGMQGAVATPKIVVVTSSTTFSSNYDEKIVITTPNIILQLLDGAHYFQEIEIVFVANASIKYRNINGVITDSSSSAPPNDYIHAGRKVTYVWNGYGWFADSGMPIGKIVMQMPNEALPARLYGGGWERQRYGHVFLRDAGSWGLCSYNVTFTGYTTCVPTSGKFSQDFWGYYEPFLVIYDDKVSSISDMSADNLTVADGIFPTSGTGIIIFGLKESLILENPTRSGAVEVRCNPSYNFRIRSANGVFYPIATAAADCDDTYNRTTYANGAFGINLDMRTGNSAMERTNRDGFKIKPACMGVHFYLRTY